MERRAQVRVWRTIVRVMFGTACVIGLVVALVPGAPFEETRIAMLYGAAVALLWMITSARDRGVSLRRPRQMKPTPLLLLASLGLATAEGLVVAAILFAVIVLDLPEGVALVGGTAVAAVGFEVLAAVAEQAAAATA